MQEVLKALWDGDYRGQILLCNIANQLQNKTIMARDIELFARAAEQRSDTFRSRSEVMGMPFPSASASSASKLYFKSHIRPKPDPNRLYARVMPLTLLLNQLAGSIRSPSVLRTILAEGPTDDNKVRERRQRILQRSLRREHPIANGTLDTWSLPPEIKEVEWFSGEMTGNLSFGDKGRPVFVAPIIEGGSLAGAFAGASSMDGLADVIRDILGLDHFGKMWFDRKLRQRQPVLLALVLFREAQVRGYTIARPTAFDETSEARFRGAFGAPEKTPGPCGRTADLSRIGSNPCEGASEVVVENGPFVGSRSVLFTVLGEVSDPRSDAYDPNANVQERDKIFVAHCSGPQTRDEVIEKIVVALS